ncbi:MAG: peptidyl-prolyl cis-trans isomerase, partial [Muribaculaceae bacterium]|nr:peptidyl-prolyl cis-trans isomerase [Muribaculaceae bacterium]
NPDKILVCVGDSALSAARLQKAVPAGLSAADSAAYAKAYIRSWIDSRLVTEVAADMIDMAEIDRLTAEYRDELIKTQYRRLMARQAGDGQFSDDSLARYYDTHLADFKLERPMIKGVYLKVPDDTENLATLRRLYNSGKPADSDRLEKAALSSAIHYDYFRDRWVDWQQVETRIPLDFGAAANNLAANKPIDLEHGGFVYLLSISDYLPVGATMPYEAAKPLIRERLLAIHRVDFDRRLRENLFNSAVADGTVSFPAVNPLK